MEDPGLTGPERGTVTAALDPLSRRLDPDQLDLVPEEGGEGPDRVGAAPDAGDHPLRQAPSATSACSRASSPITLCRSRTSAGKGAGPTAEPIT